MWLDLSLKLTRYSNCRLAALETGDIIPPQAKRRMSRTIDSPFTQIQELQIHRRSNA